MCITINGMAAVVEYIVCVEFACNIVVIVVAVVICQTTNEKFDATRDSHIIMISIIVHFFGIKQKSQNSKCY